MATDDATHRPQSEHLGLEATPLRREHLRIRLRIEWLAGAEEEHRRRTGRTMTAGELELVLRRYPGEV